MIEARLLTAPFDDPFVADLFALTERLFSADEAHELLFTLMRRPEVTVHAGYHGSELVAFKLGYADTPERYFSWLGGVDPRVRRQGLARRLMEAQHAWVRAHGYRSIGTCTLADNAAMLALNVQFGFRIIRTSQRSGTARVVLSKDFE